MNIYFSGIGGVGIGPLAEIAHDAGHEVIGSDREESLMTDKLQEKGIIICTNQNGSFLRNYHHQKKVDWFVYTAALPKDHPELVIAKELGIKTAKRDELLAEIIKTKKLKLIAIAGTHGKTTTTGMMVWAMQKLGLPISYSIGTTISFGPSGKYDKNSQYFVYECDEFDRNFLHYTPYLSVITSVDYDHPDTYPTEKDYLDAFSDFGKNSNQIITWQDQHEDIFNKHKNTIILNQNSVLDTIKIAGHHNRKNATLVFNALKQLGQKNDKKILDAISSFPGTDRRFEKLGDNLYSDYGHHPVEIAATLQMANEISDHVVLVYQPHQNIRQHEIKDQYIDQFELAESIYWLPTYLSREDPNLEILEPKDLIQNITNKDTIKIADFDQNLWNDIQSARKNGKMVLCMGAGKIDGWVREKLKKS